MFRYLAAGLLLFPWLVALHIALGAYRAARCKAAAQEPIEQNARRSRKPRPYPLKFVKIRDGRVIQRGSRHADRI